MINSKRIEIILLLKGRAVEEKVLGKKAWNEKPPIKLKVLSLQYDTVCCSQYKSYDFKMEFSSNFFRVYANLLKMSNVSEYSRSLFLGNHTQV